MNRDWYNYINSNNRNSDRYSMDCALVTALNANYHLNNEVIKQNSDEYNELAELCGCVYGAAIAIDKVYENLDLCRINNLDRFEILSSIKDSDFNNCLYELRVWSIRFGNHSVALIDYEKKSDAYRILNLSHYTTSDGWIFGEELIPLIHSVASHMSSGSKIIKR